jgi:sugar phosphate isomerase/epimerase
MTARSCHFKLAELEDTRISVTLEWAAALGLTYVVITDLQFAGQDWQQTFDLTNRYGERVRKAALQLAIHTPPDIWNSRDGQLAFATMLREVEPENCVYQLDLSTTLMSGIDAGRWMESHPGRFFSVHLRDGRKPSEPVRYLPALPLGQGEIDFKSVLAGAKTAGVTSCIVEMTVMPPEDSILAYQKSADFIRSFDQRGFC